MPPIIDANVALRYLLKDIPEQFALADSAISNGCEITPEAMAEVVYVLSKVYQVPREDISKALLALLDSVYMERSDEVSFALGLFASSSLDFVDCILIGMHSVSNRSIITFDKKVNKRIAAD